MSNSQWHDGQSAGVDSRRIAAARVDRVKERISGWHPAAQQLSGRTKVYYVGPLIVSLEHVCRVFPQRPSDRKARKLSFYQAMHSAAPAAYCEKCDTLFIQEEETNG